MKLTLMTMAALLVGTTAYAGGLAEPIIPATPAPPVAFTSDWSGVYAGVSAGALLSAGECRYTLTDVPPTEGKNTTTAQTIVEPAPVVPTICDRADDDVDVVGGVFAGGWVDLGYVVVGGEAAAHKKDSYEYQTLTARVGVDLGDALFYGMAGKAYAGGDEVDAKGVGFVQRIGDTERWTVGGEYMVMDFDSEIKTLTAKIAINF